MGEDEIAGSVWQDCDVGGCVDKSGGQGIRISEETPEDPYS